MALGGPRRVTILGSTGSVGRSTVDLLSRNRDAFQVVALTANRNVDNLAAQARDLGAEFAAVADPEHYAALKAALSGSGIEIAAGTEAVVEAARRSADWVMAAIVGACGLAPTLAAVQRGATVALANKECLVCAGSVMMDAVRHSGATLLPVDSEHNAIFQVLDRDRLHRVARIILTASGGPFRHADLATMAAATPAQAVAHPTWSMGAKISIDSATMMNKGLEIIEASILFGMAEPQVAVVVHPQSIVHSLVEYVDGSVLAQLGSPDMRTPIAHTLAWPDRLETPTERLDLAQVARLDFEPPDEVRFPALRLAREALRAGGTAPAVLNAANEVAVQAFLDERIGFLDIARTVEEVLSEVGEGRIASLEDVTATDIDARRRAEAVIDRRQAA